MANGFMGSFSGSRSGGRLPLLSGKQLALSTRNKASSPRRPKDAQLHSICRLRGRLVI